MHEQLVRVEHLRIELESSGIQIDDDVSLSLNCGEVLGLVGESASGKTTAAVSLLAYQRRGARIAAGNVLLKGRDVLGLSPSELRKTRGGVIAYVPQDPSMSLNPALRIHTQLLEVLEEHGFGNSRGDREGRLRDMMDEVLLPGDADFLKRYPHQLSGGQQQRVVLAMAFACRPAVIVLDEPTTGLDVTTQAHILQTIRRLLAQYGVSALYVTHDLAVIAAVADRVAVMYAGRLVETGSRHQIFSKPVHPYTRKLLSAVPDVTARTMPQGIPGIAPRPGHRPAGCAFSARCDLVVDRCRHEVPPMEQVAIGQHAACWRWADLVSSSQRTGEGSLCRWLRPTKQGGGLLELTDVSAWHGRRQTLDNVELAVRSGECTALVGESGSGKTTLARCIVGLHKGRVEGTITFGGQALRGMARKRPRQTRQAIQYIFQSPYSSLNPRKTVAQLLGRPLKTFFDMRPQEMERRMVEALAQVALDGSVMGCYPDQISGGERQRVAIARALCAQPALLICDEVTSSLDVSVQATIVELLSRLIDETGVAVVFVTHHLALVRAIAQEVVVMSDGRIVEAGTTEQVLGSPQADYTRHLLADTPQIPL